MTRSVSVAPCRRPRVSSLPGATRVTLPRNAGCKELLRKRLSSAFLLIPSLVCICGPLKPREFEGEQRCIVSWKPRALQAGKEKPGYHPAPASIAHLPLAPRVVLYFVLADFGHYWIHRLTHTKYLWRVHKWHHSPTYMYWLGGVRTTVPDFFMVNIPYVLAYSVLWISPWWMANAMAVQSILQNDWMHMNVTWRSRWLEWIIVTPRYHHIHHSDNPEHYGKNMASLFTIWDRLFGTYLDPEKVDKNLSFGTGETNHPARLVVGV
jgi:sterol desaturase/sphingolipid hydroxylase (fatty acid hydroxylase superfamily)